MPLFEKTELYSCPCLHFGPSFVCLMSVAAFDWDQLAKNPTTGGKIKLRKIEEVHRCLCGGGRARRIERTL